MQRLYSYKYISQFALAVALAGSTSAAFAAQAGTVVFVTGDVKLSQRTAILDQAVNEGDELTTGVHGYVYVKTIDGGFLILRPNSKARIIAYHLDAGNPANTRVKLELLQGVARTISGQGVKQARQNFRFNTPVAAIGVRGTDFTVYTDQQTSRVAVISGGVVVSGFAGACAPDGGGPCEGGASRELFAGQPGMLLQVQRGQNAPKLMHNPAASPDVTAPPRLDEPSGKAAASTAVSAVVPAAPAIVLEVKKDIPKAPAPETPPAGTGGGSVKPEAPPPPPPVTPAPLPVVPAVPVAPTPPSVPVTPAPEVVKGPPEVLWGRYQAVAGMPADKEALEKMKSGGYNYGAAQTVGSYAIVRASQSALVMPREGVASFALSGSEAMLQKDGRQPMVAQVQDGSLTVDFAARNFSTSLLLVSPDGRVALSGKGDVHAGGELINRSNSDMIINGFLGGAKADEAGYIFKKIGGQVGYGAEGATKWTR